MLWEQLKLHAVCDIRPGFWTRSLLGLGEDSEGGAFQFK